MVVTEVPLLVPGVESRPSSSTVTQPAAADTDPAEASSNSSAQTFETQQDVQWTKNKRQLMAEKGLYRRHSLEHPLLKEFATYLEKDLQNENYKQEVENVARFLFYMDPAVPSLLFVRNREKSKMYIRELSEAKLSKQTQLNYFKSLKKFLQFHTMNRSLRRDDEKLHGDCVHFIEYIGYLQKSCSKMVSKEIVQKRFDMLTQPDQLSPRDWAVLDKAKADFLKVIGKVFPIKDFGVELELSECLLVLCYLEAVVILKHLQRPGVVEHMTMSEWESRTHDPKTNTAVVGVKNQCTPGGQWFGVYCKHVRPSFFSPKRQKRSWGDVQDQDYFFISSSAKPIYNASNDLNRLHEKYGLKLVTSQMVRRIFETATKCLGDAEKSLVADYLTHSTATAEKHYRMRQPQNVAMARNLLCRLAGDYG